MILHRNGKLKKVVDYIDIIFRNLHDIWIAWCKLNSAVGQSDVWAGRLDRMATGPSSISQNWGFVTGIPSFQDQE
ncbi:hypothetical protein ANANG_G00260890 [Anguilla anguilla]|uniref:Uncharacterized protein n=1 Tax=Anguilla anguilla TaxID=7936 RepID=A0A9D3LTD7_ANGAN|nr:hypothetical protein ANANG_G00260890 [Anguilla anguilla]